MEIQLKWPNITKGIATAVNISYRSLHYLFIVANMQQHFVYERSKVYQLDMEHLRRPELDAPQTDLREVSLQTFILCKYGYLQNFPVK